MDVDEELSKSENYYSLADLFHQVHLDSPIDAKSVYSSSTELVWYGDATEYEILYSDNPEFENAESIFIGQNFSSNAISYLFSSMSIGFMFVGSICIRKRKSRILLLLVLLLIFITSCSFEIITSPYKPSTIQHSTTINDLQANTIYYWKVIAFGNDGINSESEIQVFMTGNF